MRIPPLCLQQIPLLWRRANDSEKENLDFHKILFISAYFNCSLCHANHGGLFFLFRRSSHLGSPICRGNFHVRRCCVRRRFRFSQRFVCDLGSQALFGFNGLLVLCGCVAISLLSFFLIKVNWKSALLLGGALAAIRALLEFFFFYLIWGYENIQLIFIHSVLPIFIYTTVLTPLFLLLIRKIKEKCDGQWKE